MLVCYLLIPLNSFYLVFCFNSFCGGGGYLQFSLYEIMSPADSIISSKPRKRVADCWIFFPIFMSFHKHSMTLWRLKIIMDWEKSKNEYNFFRKK